jgi:hypothetical protein
MTTEINLTQLRERAESKDATYGDLDPVQMLASIEVPCNDLLALIDTAEAALAFQNQAVASATGYDRPDPELAATENALWQTLSNYTYEP